MVILAVTQIRRFAFEFTTCLKCLGVLLVTVQVVVSFSF